MSLHALKGNQLELLVPKSVHIYSMELTRQTMTLRSKVGYRGQCHKVNECKTVCMVYGRQAPARVCMSIRLLVGFLVVSITAIRTTNCRREYNNDTRYNSRVK